jgi:hypothetical protein
MGDVMVIWNGNGRGRGRQKDSWTMTRLVDGALGSCCG